jgi:hypothetical protein
MIPTRVSIGQILSIYMFLKGSDLTSFFRICPGTYFLCPVSTKVCPSSSNRIRGTTTPSGVWSVNIPPGSRRSSRTIREFTMWFLPKWIFHRHIQGRIHTTGTPNFTTHTCRNSNPTHTTGTRPVNELSSLRASANSFIQTAGVRKPIYGI